MRKIVASEFLSLDGVMEAPEQWHFPYVSEDMKEFNLAQILAPDTLLLGRVTYEIFAGFWPSAANDESGIANKLNNAPKYVVSSTLTQAGWNNSTLISENVTEEITRLKQQPGGDIGITGSATLVQSLLQAGLVDELHLMVHPIVIGRGKRLFKDGMDQIGLKLVESRTFKSGVIFQNYQADKKA